MDGEIGEKNSSFSFMSKSSEIYRQAPNSLFYFAQVGLRIVVIAFTLAGAITMVTNNQTVTVFGLVMSAHYSISSSFRFKVIADSIACGLSVLSLLHVVALNRPKSNPNNYFYLMLLDLMSVVLLLSGCSASMAIGYVGRFGQEETGWLPICDRVEKFCDRSIVSIVLSFLAFIVVLLLTVTSAHKLKS